MVEIRNVDQLDAALRGKRVEWNHVIAMRAALRVFPFWKTPNRRPDLTLKIIRALFFSRAAVEWPSREIRAAASAAAREGTVAVREFVVLDFAAPFAAAAAYAAAAATASPRDATAAHAADAAATAAAAATHTEVMWTEIADDVEALLEAKDDFEVVQTLAQTPLWSGGHPFPTIAESWAAMKAELAGRSAEVWQPWIEWYDRVLSGEALAFGGLSAQDNDAFCRQLATEPNAFWQRDVAIVNAEIRDRLHVLRSSVVSDLLVVAPPRAAMIQPVWQGDVLHLPSLPAAIDQGADFVQVLRALKDDLNELADDVEIERNTNSIDPRIVTYLRRLADRVPLANPTHYDVHRLGLAQSNLSTYLTAVVAAEWPNYLAARTLGAMHHFDRVMRQLPSWREFKRNAENDIENLGDVNDIAGKIEAIALAISPTNVTVVDVAVSAAIRLQVEGVTGLEDDGLAFNKQLIAYDAREGARNTFKALADKFLHWMGPGFVAEHNEFGDKLGRTLYRFLAASVVGCGVTVVTAASGHNLAEVAELVLKSPEALKFLDGSDGWVAGFLTFLATNFVGGKGRDPQ